MIIFLFQQVLFINDVLSEAASFGHSFHVL